MGLRFVVFDLDGTLVDTSRDIADSLNAALAEWDLPPLQVSQVLAFVGDGSRRLVDRAVAAAGGDPGLAPQIAERFLEIYSEHLLDNTGPYPGIPELLDGLRGLPLCVYSNKKGDFVRRVVGALGWSNRFRIVLGGDWGGPRKPAPDGLVHIARTLGLPPQSGIMIGDGPTDILAAKAAGYVSAAVGWGFKPKDKLESLQPDLFFESPKILQKYLKNRLDGPQALK